MVIGNGVGNRAGFVRFEQPLQAVVLTANLVLGHPKSILCAEYIARQQLQCAERVESGRYADNSFGWKEGHWLPPNRESRFGGTGSTQFGSIIDDTSTKHERTCTP